MRLGIRSGLLLLGVSGHILTHFLIISVVLHPLLLHLALSIAMMCAGVLVRLVHFLKLGLPLVNVCPVSKLRVLLLRGTRALLDRLVIIIVTGLRILQHYRVRIFAHAFQNINGLLDFNLGRRLFFLDDVYFGLLWRRQWFCRRLFNRLLFLFGFRYSSNSEISDKRLGHLEESLIVLMGFLVDFIAWDECVGLVFFTCLLLFIFSRHLQVEHCQFPGEWIQVVHVWRVIWDVGFVIMCHRRIKPLIMTQVLQLILVSLL